MLLCASTAGTSADQKADPAAAAADAEDDDPSKFFWFHKPGLDASVVRSDISYCLLQSLPIEPVRRQSSGGGGLLGALVEGVINGVSMGVERRRLRDAGMRKCMGLYGYARYRMAEPDWNAMMRAPDVLDRMVAFASGGQPETERVDP
jgi:hypothetical protein